MKRYTTMGLAAVALGGSLLPAAAGTGIIGTTGARGGSASAVSVTVPGYGNGNPALVATRITLPRNGASFSNRGFGGVSSFPGVVTRGSGASVSAASITVPGYGNGNPALVAIRANLRGNRGDFSNRDGAFGQRGNSNFGRCGNSNDNGGVTIVYPDNGWNYNNANYLGLPPWYRLNYYTPTTQDYENGTAYQNIPSSHASLGYGVPEDYPGATSYRMPNPQANAPGQQAAADVDFVVGVQRELRRRGYYTGIVNGISDAATRSAIRSFEASAGLPVTGVIGVPLLRMLGFF